MAMTDKDPAINADALRRALGWAEELLEAYSERRDHARRLGALVALLREALGERGGVASVGRMHDPGVLWVEYVLSEEMARDAHVDALAAGIGEAMARQIRRHLDTRLPE